MKILVTGGAGFIGSHIIDELLTLDHEPVILDNFSTGQDRNVPAGIKVYKIDLSDEGLTQVFAEEKFEAVCHLAAATNVRKSVANPLNDIKNNVAGMVNLLEAAKSHNIKKFVFSSTGGALYGNTDQLPTVETHPTKPISPYGIDKLTGENYLFFYHKVYGMPVSILRYSNVYGPRQDRKGEGGAVAVFAKQMLDKKISTINGTGEQTRDFVFVKDVAHANVLALLQETTGYEAYNIATGVETSVNTLYSTLEQALGVSTTPAFNPDVKGEIMHSCLDNSKARIQLGWTPEFSLSQGLEATVDYLKDEYKVL